MTADLSQTPEAAGLEVVAWDYRTAPHRKWHRTENPGIAEEERAEGNEVVPYSVTAASAQAAIDAEKARADRLAKALEPFAVPHECDGHATVEDFNMEVQIFVRWSVIKAARAALAAAPASPLPGGSDEKLEDEKFIREYPEAVRKGDWERVARLLSERLRQMDKRSKAANTRADALIAELKEAREHLARCVELVPAPGAIEAADAFLARNGKGEG